MTSKDKTREKLMGSMRKTKADAGLETDKPETTTTPTRPAEAAEPRAASKAKQAAVVSPPAAANADAYQSGRRVWPD